MQVIKPFSSYLLDRYDHENVILIFLPPIFVSAKQIL